MRPYGRSVDEFRKLLLGYHEFPRSLRYGEPHRLQTIMAALTSPAPPHRPAKAGQAPQNPTIPEAATPRARGIG